MASSAFNALMSSLSAPAMQQAQNIMPVLSSDSGRSLLSALGDGSRWSGNPSSAVAQAQTQAQVRNQSHTQNAIGYNSVSTPSVDYINADLAKAYKMSAETAYQEALSNTSYQRAVSDLKAAGLNPVLAMGKVTGADSFAGASAVSGGMTAGNARSVTDTSKFLSGVADMAGAIGTLVSKNRRVGSSVRMAINGVGKVVASK